MLRLFTDFNGILSNPPATTVPYKGQVSVGEEVVVFDPDCGEMLGRVVKVYPSPWTGNTLLDIDLDADTFITFDSDEAL